MAAEARFPTLRGDDLFGKELRVNSSAGLDWLAFGLRFDQTRQTLIALLTEKESAMLLATEVAE
jgi:hypothetical protein